jgi:hypothetical protein
MAAAVEAFVVSLREELWQEKYEMTELLEKWKTFQDNLPEGEYKGLGELRWWILNMVKRMKA